MSKRRPKIIVTTDAYLTQDQMDDLQAQIQRWMDDDEQTVCILTGCQVKVIS